MTDRCAIFIDGGYLDAVLRDQFNSARVDYQKLASALSPGVPVLRTYYYTCAPYQRNPPSESDNIRFSGHQKFMHYLESLPNYEVRLGRLAYRGVDSAGQPILEQKEVDILLAAELLRLSMRRSIFRAILVTGDSDFIPVIKMAKDEGVEIFLAHGDHPHVTLVMAVDQRIRINQDFINSVRKT